MKTSQSGLIRLIAIFKLLKATVLVVVGVGILKLIHNDVATVLDHWVAMLGLDPGNRYVDHALRKAANIPPNRIKDLGLGSFVYAALFLTEGIGLWLLKRWAEWFTVVITASLVPLEVWELRHHPTTVKILVLMINICGSRIPSLSNSQGELRHAQDRLVAGSDTERHRGSRRTAVYRKCAYRRLSSPVLN